MSTPQFPERGQNIFQDARRRGLAGIVGGTLDNAFMGMTDFDKRGDSLGQAANKKFLKEFIFGTEGKNMGDMGDMAEPSMPVPGMPPLAEDILDPMGDKGEKRNESVKQSEKTVTDKVDDFLDPTGDLAEKRLDSLNIGGKDYNVYTDQFTGQDFIPFDPRISGNKEDFNRHGQPLTDKEKELQRQGIMFQSSIPNPLSKEDQIRRSAEGMKVAF